MKKTSTIVAGGALVLSAAFVASLALANPPQSRQAKPMSDQIRRQLKPLANPKFTEGKERLDLKFDEVTVKGLEINRDESRFSSGSLFPFKSNAAVLSGMSIMFHTNDDDKDFDSNIEVAVDNHRWLVGRGYVGYGTTFPDNSDSPTYNIPVAGYYTPDDLKSGRLFVVIHPNGNDTWRFRTAKLLFQYSDGSWQSWSWGNTWVSEEARQALHNWP